MKSFDIKRFGQLAKWSLLTGKKKILSLTAGMTIGMVAAFIPLMLFADAARPEDVKMMRLDDVVHSCAIIMWLSFMICGCWLFCNMKTKQERITYLMLPASVLEKYLVRYLTITVGVAVCWFVAFCVADVIRIAVSSVTGRSPLVSALPILFRNLVEPGLSGSDMLADGVPSHTYLYICFVMFWHSTYVLGGTLFRRRQFIFTSVTILAGVIFLAWILEQVRNSVSWSLTKNDVEAFIYALDVVVTILTMACYWASYRLFKRMQVINNKWINL